MAARLRALSERSLFEPLSNESLRKQSKLL